MNDEKAKADLIHESAMREIASLDYQAFLDEANERLRYQTEFAQAALKNLLIVNGGAIVALLTYIGNSKHNVSSGDIKFAFAGYSLGICLSLAAYFGAYYSQLFFMNVTVNQTWNAQRRMFGYDEPYEITRSAKYGDIALAFAVLATVMSLLAFLIGSYFAFEALL